MSKYVSVPIPWRNFGNRRGISDIDLMENQELLEFFQRFHHCFEDTPLIYGHLFIEPEELQHADTI